MSTLVNDFAVSSIALIPGIIVGAVGVEGVLAHAGDGGPSGRFSAATLCGGFALYLVGHLLVKQRPALLFRRRPQRGPGPQE